MAKETEARTPKTAPPQMVDPWGQYIWPIHTLQLTPDVRTGTEAYTPLEAVRPSNPLAQGLPSWFAQMPTEKMYQLTPFAASVLRDLFPVIPKDVIRMPYIAHAGGYLLPQEAEMPFWTQLHGGVPQPPLPHDITALGAVTGSAVPYVGPTVAMTEAVIPEAASAQTLRKIKKLGLEPILSDYMKTIGVEWDAWMNRSLAAQPHQTKPSRIPRWGAVKQA